jgi:hypothetical protein
MAAELTDEVAMIPMWWATACARLARQGAVGVDLAELMDTEKG